MIDSAHIRSAFDADLENIRNLILEMGSLVEAQIDESADVLHKRDEERARAVIDKDKRVDALEMEIDYEAVRVLALRQPIAQDLRSVIVVMKIAGNLERIGDYAKNNAKRTQVIAQSQPEGSSRSVLKQMSKAVQGMLRDVLNSYVNMDVELAEDVRARDEEIDLLHNGLFRELLTHMMEDPRNISAAMHLQFVSKNLERIGDHITSMAEQVIFLVSGEVPDDDRARGDDSYLKET